MPGKENNYMVYLSCCYLLLIEIAVFAIPTVHIINPFNELRTPKSETCLIISKDDINELYEAIYVLFKTSALLPNISKQNVGVYSFKEWKTQIKNGLTRDQLDSIKSQFDCLEEKYNSVVLIKNFFDLHTETLKKTDHNCVVLYPYFNKKMVTLLDTIKQIKGNNNKNIFLVPCASSFVPLFSRTTTFNFLVKSSKKSKKNYWQKEIDETYMLLGLLKKGGRDYVPFEIVQRIREY